MSKLEITRLKLLGQFQQQQSGVSPFSTHLQLLPPVMHQLKETNLLRVQALALRLMLLELLLDRRQLHCSQCQTQSIALRQILITGWQSLLQQLGLQQRS